MSFRGTSLWKDPNNKPYPITGITQYLNDGDPIPVRREIDEWYASEKAEDELQVYIFLRAMQNFQKQPDDNMLSCFQVAGIHGLPYTPWLDGSKGPPPEEKNRMKNYRTHNTILFATWHRPYLLCFEQLVFAHMEKFIGLGHEDKEWPPEMTPRLQAVIKTWRLPYWD
ncbi:hypothetical protein TWF281_010547 [Arthrobotrys megalospora]